MREWLRGRWARKGVTLAEFTAMCDRGEIEGLEPGFELEVIWG